MRYLIGTIIALIVFTFVRAVWSVVQKAIFEEVSASLGNGEKTEATKEAGPKRTLRKCAVCGTYKPESSMISVRQGVETTLYCSKDCQRRALTTAT
jgi:hypothetical protein